MQTHLLEKTQATCTKFLDKTEDTLKDRGIIKKDAQRPPDATLLKRFAWIFTQIFILLLSLLREFPQNLKERCHSGSDNCWCRIPSNLVTYKEHAIRTIKSHLPKKSNPPEAPKKTQVAPESRQTKDNETGRRGKVEETEDSQGEPSKDITTPTPSKPPSPAKGLSEKPQSPEAQPTPKGETKMKEETEEEGAVEDKRDIDMNNKREDEAHGEKVQETENIQPKEGATENEKEPAAADKKKNGSPGHEENQRHEIVAEFAHDSKVTEGVSFAEVVKGNTENMAAA